MGQAIPFLIQAAAAGAQVYNTQQTERRQDEQLASSIQRQTRRQEDADSRVSQEVDAMAASQAGDERRQRLDDYMGSLRRNQSGITDGLTPSFGSEAFRDDSARAVADVNQGAGRTAGLMARIDAPHMQRQGEAFGYGNLATDLGLIGRQSRGDQFINDIRLRAIRRDPWLDAGSQLASGYASAMGTNPGVPAAQAASAAEIGGGRVFRFGGLGGLGY